MATAQELAELIDIARSKLLAHHATIDALRTALGDTPAEDYTEDTLRLALSIAEEASYKQAQHFARLQQEYDAATGMED